MSAALNRGQRGGPGGLLGRREAKRGCRPVLERVRDGLAAPVDAPRDVGRIGRDRACRAGVHRGRRGQLVGADVDPAVADARMPIRIDTAGVTRVGDAGVVRGRTLALAIGGRVGEDRRVVGVGRRALVAGPLDHREPAAKVRRRPEVRVRGRYLGLGRAAVAELRIEPLGPQIVLGAARDHVLERHLRVELGAPAVARDAERDGADPVRVRSGHGGDISEPGGGIRP